MEEHWHWQPYYCEIPAGYREERSHVKSVSNYDIVWHLLDIDWNKTKSEPCHIIWPSRYTRSGGQSNSHKWLASWKIRGSVEEFETLPAGSHGYHTIIDRLDTKVGRLWVTLLGNLQPPPEPKNNEEWVPSPVIVLYVYIRHCTNNLFTHPSRLWSARTATRTGLPFNLMSNIAPFMSSPPRRPHIPIRPAVVIVYCLIACSVDCVFKSTVGMNDSSYRFVLLRGMLNLSILLVCLLSNLGLS